MLAEEDEAAASIKPKGKKKKKKRSTSIKKTGTKGATLKIDTKLEGEILDEAASPDLFSPD